MFPSVTSPSFLPARCASRPGKGEDWCVQDVVSTHKRIGIPQDTSPQVAACEDCIAVLDLFGTCFGCPGDQQSRLTVGCGGAESLSVVKGSSGDLPQEHDPNCLVGGWSEDPWGMAASGVLPVKVPLIPTGTAFPWDGEPCSH